MAGSDKSGDKTGTKTRRGLLGRLAHTLLILLIVAGVVMVGGVFAVQTEPGRAWVRSQIARRTGMDVAVGNVRIGLPYALVLERVETPGGGDAEKGRFTAEEIRISAGMRPLLRVSARQCALTLVQRPDGGWDPSFFAVLGSLPARNLASISRLTAAFRDSTAVEVADGSIRWLTGDGTRRASASGIGFRMCPGRIADRRLYHYGLSVYGMVGLEGVPARDVEREWLALEGRDYVEIRRVGPARGTGGDFWTAGEAVRTEDRGE